MNISSVSTDLQVPVYDVFLVTILNG